MYGAFHPKSDTDRLYLKRKEGGRGLISVETCEGLKKTTWVCMCVSRNGLERAEKWYEHCPDGAVENDDFKLIWDINIQ